MCENLGEKFGNNKRIPNFAITKEGWSRGQAADCKSVTRRLDPCSFLKKRTVVESAETGFATGGETYHERPWITFEIVMHRRL